MTIGRWLGVCRIVRIPFTGSVKLRSLLLKTGPADHTPTKVVLVRPCPVCSYGSLTLLHQYANEPSLDFGDIADKVPTQEFDVAQGREVGEYALKYVSIFLWSALALRSCRASKFSNLASIALFFPEAQGADTTQIYYVGFLGTWTEVTEEAGLTKCYPFTYVYHYSARTILSLQYTRHRQTWRTTRRSRAQMEISVLSGLKSFAHDLYVWCFMY